MMKRIYQFSYNNEIEVRKIRYVMNYYFRMGYKNLNSLLIEMKKLGIIEYKNKQLILLLWNPKIFKD